MPTGYKKLMFSAERKIVKNIYFLFSQIFMNAENNMATVRSNVTLQGPLTNHCNITDDIHILLWYKRVLVVLTAQATEFILYSSNMHHENTECF
jgi:hypothetical protein